MKAHLKALLAAASLAGFVGFSPATADPLDEWTWRVPTPQGNNLNAVIYANNTFIAVGDAGTVVTSPDGVTWTLRPTPARDRLRGVRFGNGQFVAVGGSDISRRPVVMTSPDGQSWRSQHTTAKGPLTSITFGNGLFAAAVASFEANRGIVTSPDGSTWQEQNAGTGDNLGTVTFMNGLFVVVEGRSFMTSPDGVTWARRTIRIGSSMNGVTYANGVFVATGDLENGLMTSSDGITWTTQTSTSNLDMYGVVHGAGQFVAVGAQGRIATSTDGMNFARQQIGAFNDTFHSVAYGAGKFVVVGDGGRIFTSPDAGSWTERSQGPNVNLNAITFGNDTLVAVGSVAVEAGNATGVALTSKDGISWNQHDAGLDELTSVAFGNDVFVAGTPTGSVLTSPDGVTWTPRDTGAVSGVLGLAYGSGVFVLIVNEKSGGRFGGRILSSNNGITWTPRTDPSPRRFESVSFANGAFYVGEDPFRGIDVALAAGLLVSADGQTWTRREVRTLAAIHQVVYGDDRFAVSITTDPWLPWSTALLISSDAQEWRVACSGFRAFDSTVFADGLFIAAGGMRGLATLATSPDGISWHRRRLSASHTLKSLVVAHGSLFAVGESFRGSFATGAILQSGPLKSMPVTVSVSAEDSDAGEVGANPGQFRITRSGDTAAELNVRLSLAGTARNGVDYESVPESVMIRSGERVAKVVIRPKADGEAEGLETVTLTLEEGTGYELTAADSAFVTIVEQVDPLDNWQLRNGLRSRLRPNLSSIAHGHGTFVAVATHPNPNSPILASSDGVTWTNRSGGWLNSVTYGDGLFVAVGDGGVVRTSTNGTNWASIPSRTSATLLSVTRGSGLFVAVGQGLLQGAIVTSPNGTNWTTQTNGLGRMRLHSVAYGGGQFVAAGDFGLIGTSPDGVAWTRRDEVEPVGVQLKGLAYGNNLWVAVGGGGGRSEEGGVVLTSPDGITWTERCVPMLYSLAAVAFGDGYFVATEGHPDSRPEGARRVLFSPDGVTWSARELQVGGGLRGLTFANGAFMGVGWDGVIVESGRIAPPRALFRFLTDGITRSADGTVQLRLEAPLGSMIFLEGSADLLNWAPVSTNSAASSPVILTDPDTSKFPQRFYRAVAK